MIAIVPLDPGKRRYKQKLCKHVANRVVTNANGVVRNANGVVRNANGVVRNANRAVLNRIAANKSRGALI